jgi:protein SCO1
MHFPFLRLVSVLTVLVASVGFLPGCSDQSSTSSGLASRPQGGDFVLQSATGPVDTRSLRGKVVLVFFGYTHCPDVCPAAMAAGAQALNGLTPEERAKTKMLMISVDPERDTPETLKNYVAYFHPEMIGLTGTPAEIAVVAKMYGAGYIKQPANAEGAYAVDHTAQTYIVAPDGRLAEILQPATSKERMLAVVRGLLP